MLCNGFYVIGNIQTLYGLIGRIGQKRPDFIRIFAQVNIFVGIPIDYIHLGWLLNFWVQQIGFKITLVDEFRSCSVKWIMSWDLIRIWILFFLIFVLF